MNNQDGGAAFPRDSALQTRGMSLRDWFAGQADVPLYMPLATLTDRIGRQPSMKELAEYIAKIRIIEADTMLAEREKGQQE
jgi:hypothetical protein